MGTLGTSVASSMEKTNHWIRGAVRALRRDGAPHAAPPGAGTPVAGAPGAAPPHTAPAGTSPPDGALIARPADVAPVSHAALPADATGAVIIPAHNESAVIGRTLRSLAPLTALDGVEVIVACNGCSDATADIARGFPGVQVAETDEASKPVGLNLGDRMATAWPRLYLDADIEVHPTAVLAVFEALVQPGVLAARPRHVYDAEHATGPVRSYYRARSRIGGPASRLWGAGGYAASEEGHRRFAEFPRVTADDSWFDEQFSAQEKRVVATAPMRVRTPRDTAALLAVLTRQRRGCTEIGIPAQTASRGAALLASIRGPQSALDVAWYAVLTIASRGRAVRARRRGSGWERDTSSRVGIGSVR